MYVDPRTRRVKQTQQFWQLLCSTHTSKPLHPLIAFLPSSALSTCPSQLLSTTRPCRQTYKGSCPPTPSAGAITPAAHRKFSSRTSSSLAPRPPLIFGSNKSPLPMTQCVTHGDIQFGVAAFTNAVHVRSFFRVSVSTAWTRRAL